MKNMLKNFFFFTLFILLGIASLLGVVVPDNVPTRSVGSMQIAPFKNGLSLYQGNRPYFYTFSPFNDYYVTDDGLRNTIISEGEVQEIQYKSTLRTSQAKDITRSILSYFNAANPSIKFITDKEAEYSTKVNGNAVTVTHDFKFRKDISVQSLGSTIPFYGIDFIYDKEGNLYTKQSDEDIVSFEKFYGIKLTKKTEEFRIAIPEKSLIIVNPNVASAIVVKASDSQTMWVNRNTRMIEVEEQIIPLSGEYRSSMNVEIYENPQEAQKYL